MKTYRKGPELLAEIDEVFAARRSPGGPLLAPHPLEDALVTLLSGRQYSGLELALDLDADHGVEFALGSSEDARSHLRVPVRIGARQLGELRVFSTRENAFSSEDRVLLKAVAARLARFLTGAGKYILRHAHEQSATAATQVATAGEKSRS